MKKDGTLVNRRKEGAVITDENEAIVRVTVWSKRKRLLQLQEKILIFRQILSAFMETEPRLWRLVEKIREAFVKEGIQISSLDEFVK